VSQLFGIKTINVIVLTIDNKLCLYEHVGLTSHKDMFLMYKFSLLFILIFISYLSSADDSNYNKVRDSVFWLKLYDENYETLYCGSKVSGGKRVTVEHVYPVIWIADSLGCKNHNECKLDKYINASSDLHNLWPALKKFESSRGNLPYGEIEGEKPRFETLVCDFERTTGKNAVVEPRDEVKGQIARSFLYMVHWYDLPTHDLLPLMVKWNYEYPPSQFEIDRQKLIEFYQGRHNPFIKVN